MTEKLNPVSGFNKPRFVDGITLVVRITHCLWSNLRGYSIRPLSSVFVGFDQSNMPGGVTDH